MAFSRPRKPAAPPTEQELYEYALRALGRRMRTVAELRRLLGARQEPGAEASAQLEAVLARLREHGYLDDQAYAETYTRLRLENEKLGERRVRQALTQKGVAPEIVAETLEQRYGGQDEAALARQHLERKRIPRPTNDKETARVLRRLAAAGFSLAAIHKVLRQWGAPEESLAALESAGDETDEA